MSRHLVRRGWILAITLLILLVLFFSLDPHRVLRTVADADVTILVGASLLTLLFPLLCAIRWKLIVRQLGVDMSLWDSFKLIMAAWPLGAVTPAKSGDLIKILFLRNVMPYAQTTGVILAERLVDVIALCLYAAVWGWIYRFPGAVWMALIILAGVILFLLLAASRLVRLLPLRYRDFAVHALSASTRMCLNLRSFSAILFVSFLNWFLSFTQTWLCYRALHAEVPLTYIMAVLPIAIFIGLVPITLSGMGTRDSAVIVLFQNYAPSETSLSVGILYSIFGYWILSLLGIPFMRSAFTGAIGGVSGSELSRVIYDPPHDS